MCLTSAPRSRVLIPASREVYYLSSLRLLSLRTTLITQSLNANRPETKTGHKDLCPVDILHSQCFTFHYCHTRHDLVKGVRLQAPYNCTRYIPAICVCKFFVKYHLHFISVKNWCCDCYFMTTKPELLLTYHDSRPATELSLCYCHMHYPRTARLETNLQIVFHRVAFICQRLV